MQTKTIPQIAHANKTLDNELDDVLCVHNEMEDTAQIIARLAMQANADLDCIDNIDFETPQDHRADIAQVEDLLCQAAQIYARIAANQKRA